MMFLDNENSKGFFNKIQSMIGYKIYVEAMVKDKMNVPSASLI